MHSEDSEITAMQDRIRHLEKIVMLERRLREQLKKSPTSGGPAAQSPTPQRMPASMPLPDSIYESTLVARNTVDPTIVRGPRPDTGTMAGDAAPLPLGFRLFEYRIDAVLGQGGFGITYLATDVHLNVKVAIKEYLPSDFAMRKADKTVVPRTEADADFYQTWLDNFLIEARTLATFRHPHIVRVARFFEAHHTAYMVLEYEHGKPLSAWLKEQSSISERDVLTLIHPLLDGLAAVHAAGYLHRDIKPDNIYVRSQGGDLVLLDFGSACSTAGAGRDIGFVFTPGYAPHEQYMGGHQGPWTDLYAVGATLYWLVTGKKPSPVPVRQENPEAMVPAESAGKGRYSPEFLQAIDWALKMDPNERPQTMTEFCQVLFAHHAGSLGLLEALSTGETGAPPVLVESKGNQPNLLVRVRNALVHWKKTLSRPNSWPLVGKLTTALILAALLPMVITAYYNFSSGVALTSSTELRNLERFAESTAGRVSQLIDDSRHMANYLGTDADFIAFLSAPTPALDTTVNVKLQSLLKSNPDVRLLTLMNDLGTIVASSDAAVVGRSFEFRDYFKEAMAGRPFMTGIIVGSDNTPGVYYSQPVVDPSGKVLGLVLLRIKGDTVATILKMVGGQEEDRTPFLVDEDGILVLYPDPAKLYSSLVPLSDKALKGIVTDQRFRRDRIDSLDMPDLARAMVGATRPGNIRYHSTLSNSEDIAGFAPVPGTRWVVGVTESVDRFEAPLNRLFSNVLYSVVVVGVIFFIIAAMLARSLVRPIARLTEAAEALKQGDYDRATVEVTSTDELGRLARTFNVMIDILRQRERERRRK
jgi:serine/threonine protein kinase/HAMP domain-containing protein